MKQNVISHHAVDHQDTTALLCRTLVDKVLRTVRTGTVSQTQNSTVCRYSLYSLQTCSTSDKSIFARILVAGVKPLPANMVQYPARVHSHAPYCMAFPTYPPYGVRGAPNPTETDPSQGWKQGRTGTVPQSIIRSIVHCISPYPVGLTRAGFLERRLTPSLSPELSHGAE